MLVPVLFGISVLAFMLGMASPGDPVEAILNPDGTQIIDQKEYDIVRERLGLDDPVPVQYVKWLKNALTGELGRSFFTNKEIKEQMAYRLPYTIRLACFGMALTVVFGLLFGILMAMRRDGPVDHALRFLTTLMLSVPGFWLAILLILVFVEKLHLLPTSGLNGFSSYIMPGITVAISTIGVCARLTRTSILDELGKQYVTVASSKGLNARKVTMRHAFRNSLIPITTFLGNYFAGILGGSTIAEVIFNIPGIGNYAISAVKSRDYYVVQAYVLFTALVYVVMTLVIDLLYLVINPKIRAGEKIG
ncbi:UNVERIFIED_CONTAM: peptide/nickel transport system permease protein [Murimonas intestini]|uniref:Peptide/nickel transport system permease protein n=2 Tax=Murimonas intestini TaxID=1337051 RepID=A0AB73SXU9_9FIRM